MSFDIQARALHEALNVKTHYSDWIKRQIGYLSLMAGKDYEIVQNSTKIDHMLTKVAAGMIQARASEEYLRDLATSEATKTETLRQIHMAEHPTNLSQTALVYMQGLDMKTTSKMIADFTGKQHAHVRRDIRVVIKELEEMSPKLDTSSDNPYRTVLEGITTEVHQDSYGRPQEVFVLSFSALLTLLTKYSTKISCEVSVLLERFLRYLKDYQRARIIHDNIPQDALDHRYVYILRGVDTGRYKLGISNNPERRAYDLSSSSEDVVVVYKSPLCTNHFNIEGTIHERFKDYRIRREWFSKDLPLAEVIAFLEGYTYMLTYEVPSILDN